MEWWAATLASLLTVPVADVHAYERTCGMVTNFTCTDIDEHGTVHIVTGAAGNVYNPDWQSYLPESPAEQNTYHHEQPEWSVFRYAVFRRRPRCLGVLLCARL